MTQDARPLRKKIEDYFSACDETAEEVTGRNGRSSTRKLPYTLAGLAEHLGMAKSELCRLAAGRGPNARAVADALRRIERYTVERALLGELQSSVTAMLLADLGLGAPAKAPDEDGGRIVVVLEDREGWSD
ncbi:MAG: terminase small subunit [Clostridia bacterium]|nr:terminase small subunit [Clostridia bacterium]